MDKITINVRPVENSTQSLFKVYSALWIVASQTNSMAVVDKNTGCQMLTMYDKEVEWVQFHHEESICIYAVSKSVYTCEIYACCSSGSPPHILASVYYACFVGSTNYINPEARAKRRRYSLRVYKIHRPHKSCV